MLKITLTKHEKELIDKITLAELKKGSVEEVANIVYDTLFKNTCFPQFDIKKTKEQGVIARDGVIFFDYMGHKYKMVITEEV